MNEIITGDAIQSLKHLDPEIADCVITSPPYWGLRDYGINGQIGHEKTPEEFVHKIVEVFKEVRRVLKDDGTLWLNLGDSYCGSWGNYSGKNRGAGRQREIKNGSKINNPAHKDSSNWRPPTSGKLLNGLKSKDLVGIPWMVAFALRSAGWYLRQDIVWSKPNPMPESVEDRCTKSHEYVFLFSKSPRYYFDSDAIKENAVYPNHGRTWEERKQSGEGPRRGMKPIPQKGHTAFETGEKRNKRSVWNVATVPFSEAHFATFPEKLIEPMVLAGCPRGGVVLDPFFGAGTTGVVAKKLERNFIGIEINPEYVKMAQKRLDNIPSSLFIK